MGSGEGFTGHIQTADWPRASSGGWTLDEQRIATGWCDDGWV